MDKTTAKDLLNHLTADQYNALYNAVANNLTAKYNNDAVYLDRAGKVHVLVDIKANSLRDDLLKVCDLFDNDDYADGSVIDNWDDDAKLDHAREIVDGAVMDIETLIDCNGDDALAAWHFVEA